LESYGKRLKKAKSPRWQSNRKAMEWYVRPEA